MKKHFCLLLCILFCFLSACSSTKNSTGFVISQFESKEIIDSGDYYCIYEGDSNSINYEIYNSDGEIVLAGTTDKPLIIDMLNNHIVDIGIGLGTGISIHKYYDVSKNLFSEDYLYVLANSNELIAYIDVPDKQSFEKRRLVVRNLFDKSSFYKEFQLEFSNVDTPIIYAEFSEDSKLLSITYLSGEEQVQISEVLTLQ